MEFTKLFIKEFDLNNCSKELGKIYHSDIKNNSQNVHKYFDDNIIKENFNIVKNKLYNQYPIYLKEIYDRATGAGVNYDDYLLYVCYELYEEREKCTDVIIKLDDNKIIGGHNEDGPYSLNNIGLIKYITDYGFLCDFFTTDSLPGSAFCWNSHGLIFTCNYIYIQNKNMTGIPTWFILRNIVDSASIEEVLKKLNIEDAASGGSLNVTDTNTKKAYSIEWQLNHLSVIEINDKFAHSNHLTRGFNKKPVIAPYSNSLFRLEKSEELLKDINIKNKDDILYILQYHTNDFKKSIRNMTIKDDGMITAASFIYDTDKNIIIHSYLDNQIYNVDYDMNNLLY